MVGLRGFWARSLPPDLVPLISLGNTHVFKLAVEEGGGGCYVHQLQQVLASSHVAILRAGTWAMGTAQLWQQHA